MGLLDEAIRDHLELKRRRGADPTDLARAEREALEPVFPDEPREDDLPAQDEGAYEESPQAVGIPVEHEHGDLHDQEDSSMAGQETAEMDVQAFLDAEAAMGEAEHPPEQIPGQERLTFE